MINKFKFLYFGIFLLEVSLFSFFLFSFFPFFVEIVIADIGENATLVSGVEVGTSAPNIISIDIEQGTVSLIPNSTKIVNCTVEIEDFEGEANIKNATAEFFHSSSAYGSVDDNNLHYTNNSCYIDTSYGDEYTVLAHCLFYVWYYANAGTWNCSVVVNDFSDYAVNDTNVTQVSPLLAVGLPDTINYGLVNATYVSTEYIANVTNYGNVMINLSLSGYGVSEGDGLAMNCTLGSTKNISIWYEKYNLTESNPGPLSLSELEAAYTNLTSTPTIREFNLEHRTDDSPGGETINSTYWRIYVPVGVAGSCEGNIVFGAVQAGGG